MIALMTLLCLQPAQPVKPAEIAVPWMRSTWDANEGCWWERDAGQGRLELNAHYIRPPADPGAWPRWISDLRRYRSIVRGSLNDPGGWSVRVRFDGVRAWVRMARGWAYALDPRPGERIVLEGEGRWGEGNSTVCLAFDLCDRSSAKNGKWVGWSRVLGSTDLPRDGMWHRFRIEAAAPQFDPSAAWLRPIVGMDATHDATRGSVALRDLTFSVENGSERTASISRERTMAYDDTIYTRPGLRWMSGNFTCGFVFVYDRDFWDPDAGKYRVEELCDAADREFGGYDSVVLWHAYPRIGADDRNQFDFFRDVPGGLAGLRDVTDRFHARGVRVFIAYNPWDTGTRRETVSDDEALAGVVDAIGGDGIFLDTMVEAPAGLRAAVDAVRPGVVFEPEGHPTIEETQVCNGSWAQGLAAFPELGVLHLRWIEQRHMQHQIRRWDKSHHDEIAAAWINGSGMLVWENVFGSMNPWSARDRADWRRMAPVLRCFSEWLSGGEWLPYVPALREGVYASCWRTEAGRLWTLVNSGRELRGPVLEVPADGERFFDLWTGRELSPEVSNGKARLELPLDAFGAVLGVPRGKEPPGLQDLLARQQAEAGRPAPTPDADEHMELLPVVDAVAPPDLRGVLRVPPGRLLHVGGGAPTFVVRHMRRECGCYPDPDTPKDRWYDFLRGYPFDETMEHRVSVSLGDFSIMASPVTNAEYARFIRATGYRSRSPENLVKHWGGSKPAPEIRDEPVVYVDLEDARAYAAWAGLRLPTEWEWQHAAESLGPDFSFGEVWELTESARDDGHTRSVMLRGGSRYRAQGSVWYFPGGEQTIGTHAKFIRMWPGLDRCATIGFRCIRPL